MISTIFCLVVSFAVKTRYSVLRRTKAGNVGWTAWIALNPLRLSFGLSRHKQCPEGTIGGVPGALRLTRNHNLQGRQSNVLEVGRAWWVLMTTESDVRNHDQYEHQSVLSSGERAACVVLLLVCGMAHLSTVALVTVCFVLIHCAGAAAMVG